MVIEIPGTLEGCITFIEPELPLKGILVDDSDGYEIWFPYSVEAIKLLERNKLLGVRNISSIHLNQISGEPEELHLSLLRINEVTARHFQVDAIRESRAHSPSSVEKFIDDTIKGWQRRASEKEEVNLRLVVRAEMTGFEWYLPMSSALLKDGTTAAYPGVRPEKGRPILGDVSYLMNEVVVERLVNRGYPQPSDLQALQSEQIIEMGTHALYPSKDIGVMLDTKNLVKRHFGLFGFTGSGKSNLLSTLLSSTMETETPNNLIILDANNEYFGLLLDVLINHDSHILFVDDSGIELCMQEYLKGRVDLIDEAAEEFIQTTIWSNDTEKFWKRNKDVHERLREIVKSLLACGAFKVFAPSSNERAFDHLQQEVAEWVSDNLKFSGKGSRELNNFLTKKIPFWLELIVEDKTANVSAVMLAGIRDDLLAAITALQTSEPSETNLAESSVLGKVLAGDFPDTEVQKSFLEKFVALQNKLLEIEHSLTPPESGYRHTMGTFGLTRALHDEKKSTVIVLGDENSLRSFSYEVGMYLYRLRKRTKLEKIPTSFIFDEADLFVPQNSPNKDDEDFIKKSKEVATMLARRGRKYNLGLGIATQRVVYLDTSIMGQIGTYFVGRLPRASDRQRIVEGFGVEEKFIQENIRGVGNWTVLSHSAVGDKGAPIPVHFPNADTRIQAFIRDFDPSKYPSLVERLRRTDFYAAMERERTTVASPVNHTEYLP